MRLIHLFALLPFACATPRTNGPAVSRDTSTQINRDQRYAHASNGDVILGPSDIEQRVYGQTDAAGNIHVTTDRWFLAQAHQLSRTQLSLAEMARDRGASPEVMDLAERQESQNRLIDGRVRDLAAQRQVMLPESAPQYQELATLSGEDFDHAYVAAALSLDRQQLDLWNDLLRNSPDAQLAQLASDTLPQLRSAHRQAAATSVRM